VFFCFFIIVLDGIYIYKHSMYIVAVPRKVGEMLFPGYFTVHSDGVEWLLCMLIWSTAFKLRLLHRLGPVA